MKICCLMLYDKNRAAIGDLSAGVAKAYCQRHGYAFRLYTDVIDHSLNASWNKLVAIKRHLADYDWVLWLDADTLICNNDLGIELLIELGLGKSLIISQDRHGLCCGVFLARNKPWTFAFLDTLLMLGRVHPPDCIDGRDTWEQSTVKCLYNFFPAVKDQFALIPESLVMNIETKSVKSVPFIMHWWAACRPFVREEMVRFLADGWLEPIHRF